MTTNGGKTMSIQMSRLIKNKGEICQLIVMAGIVLAICLAAKVEILNKIPQYATHDGHKGEEQVIYNLADEDSIEQEFTCDTSFDMVTLHFSDHDQTITGKTIITITEKQSGELVYYEEKSNSDIHYGELVQIPFEEKGIQDQCYVLKLRFEGMKETGLGVFGFPAEKNEITAVVNGEPAEYHIAVGTHTNTCLFRNLVYAVLIMIIIMFATNMIMVIRKGAKEEYLFLSIALPVGIIFLMLFSVNVVHDGGTHLAKTYHFSNVLMGKAGQDSAGYVLLKDDEAEAFDEIYQDRHRENNIADMYYDTFSRFWQKNDMESWKLSHQFRETETSSILEYLPGTLGMTIGRAVGGSARFNIFLAKVFSFLFYIGMVLLAIRIAPYYKMPIAFAALLPMSLYQATGITYDSVVMAVSMVLLAVFLKARGECLHTKELVLLFGMAFWIGCCKGGFYLVFLLLFFTISKEIYGGIKSKCMVCFGSLVSGGLGVLITSFRVYTSYLKDIFGITVSQTTETVQVLERTEAVQMPEVTQRVTYGVGYFFSNMKDFIRMFIQTMIEKADVYIGSLVGYRMSWTDETINWVVIFMFLILIILACSKTDTEIPDFSVKEKVFYLIIVGIEIVGFHILMLVETPVGASVIEGVQGRYFLAWVPVAACIMYNKHRRYDDIGARRLFCYFAIVEAVYLYFFMKIFLGIA